MSGANPGRGMRQDRPMPHNGHKKEEIEDHLHWSIRWSAEWRSHAIRRNIDDVGTEKRSSILVKSTGTIYSCIIVSKRSTIAATRLAAKRFCQEPAQPETPLKEAEPCRSMRCRTWMLTRWKSYLREPLRLFHQKWPPVLLVLKACQIRV